MMHLTRGRREETGRAISDVRTRLLPYPDNEFGQSIGIHVARDGKPLSEHVALRGSVGVPNALLRDRMAVADGRCRCKTD